MIQIVPSDTRFHVVFNTIYLGSRKLPHIDFSLVVYSLSNVSHPWTYLTMMSPNTKTLVDIFGIMFLLVFVILSLLGLSVDTTTFAGYCRSGLLVIFHRSFLC